MASQVCTTGGPHAVLHPGLAPQPHLNATASKSSSGPTAERRALSSMVSASHRGSTRCRVGRSSRRRPLSKTVRPITQFSETPNSSQPGLVAMLQTSPKSCRLPVQKKGTESSNPFRSATESPSLAILHPDHRKARPSGLICKCVVAEKTTFRQVTFNSRAESPLANSERPFGPGAEWN